MPHILPCPAPRIQFADADCEYEYSEDGTRRRRRRRRRTQREDSAANPDGDCEGVGELVDEAEEMEGRRKKAHECPVPKPGGMIGEVLGFRRPKEEESTRVGTIRRGDRG